MTTIQEIMTTPLTRAELENEVQILEALLPNSEGPLKLARQNKLAELKAQLNIFTTGEVIEIDTDASIDSDNNHYRDRFNRFEAAEPEELFGLSGTY